MRVCIDRSQPRARVQARGVLLLAMALGLAGCGTSLLDPASWFATPGAPARPPVPEADAAAPNLATVPAKPAAPDSKKNQAILNGLIADRSNAQYAATQAPLPDPSSPTASPALFGGAVAPPVAQPAAPTSATLPGATASPAPPAKPAPPPAAAPRPAVQEAPLPPASSAEPTMPAAPPPPPRIAGVDVPKTTPAPPPVAPPAKPAAAPALSGAAAAAVPLAFPKGSAVLPPAQAKTLIALARRRGAHAVEAIGYGEAANDTVQTQSDALQLALERARAISAALTADGVPAAAIRLVAKPAGDGGAARLLD